MKRLKTPSGWSRASSRIWNQTGTLKAGDFIDFIEKDLLYAAKNFIPAAQFETTCKMVRVFRLFLRPVHKKVSYLPSWMRSKTHCEVGIRSLRILRSQSYSTFYHLVVMLHLSGLLSGFSTEMTDDQDYSSVCTMTPQETTPPDSHIGLAYTYNAGSCANLSSACFLLSQRLSRYHEYEMKDLDNLLPGILPSIPGVRRRYYKVTKRERYHSNKAGMIWALWAQSRCQ